MNGEPRRKRSSEALDEEELDPRLRDPRVQAWFGEHLPELRRSVSKQRILHWTLGIAFVVGLAAHVGGYLLRSSVTTEPLGLVADLLYTLGWALWTGVVVAVFITIIPETKQRQVKRMLDAYERGALRDNPGSGKTPGGQG
jgi:hypothetical protein